MIFIFFSTERTVIMYTPDIFSYIQIMWPGIIIGMFIGIFIGYVLYAILSIPSKNTEITNFCEINEDEKKLVLT